MPIQTKYKNVFLIDHPFITDSLAHLRDMKTDVVKFRRHSDALCRLLFAEAIRGLDFETFEVQTPLDVTMRCQKLKDEIILMPILRAGLAILPAALQLLPKSKVGFAGLARDEKTAKPQEYYWKVPPMNKNSVVIITDPMLATGGSILYVLNRLKKEKLKEIRVVSVIAAPEGIEVIKKEYPDICIFISALDESLNDIKYIIPGLGDYGDRYFGTN